MVLRKNIQARLTAIAHNHDFGIDTVLVPGPPVRIHARIGGHRNGSRGKEGTRKRSAGRTRGGIKGGERERKRIKKREERGRGAKRQADGAAETTKTRSITWHSIFVALLPPRVLPCTD